MPGERETMRKASVTLRALEVLSTLRLDNATCCSCGPLAILYWFQLIANAAEQLVEVFDQLLLPLRELQFLPLQRLPFLYQRAKRFDKGIGHKR